MYLNPSTGKNYFIENIRSQLFLIALGYSSHDKFFPLSHQFRSNFFTDSPDWVVMLSKRGHDGSFATADYRSLFPRGLFPGVNLERDYEEMVLPISFKDTFRPELEWHVFSPAEPDYKDQIFIYHKTI